MGPVAVCALQRPRVCERRRAMPRLGTRSAPDAGPRTRRANGAPAPGALCLPLPDPPHPGPVGEEGESRPAPLPPSPRAQGTPQGPAGY